MPVLTEINTYFGVTSFGLTECNIANDPKTHVVFSN